MVSAAPCPQVLLRVLGLFAQQDLLLDHIDASRTRRSLRITISVSDLEPHRATIIAEKMRQVVRVRSVRLTTVLKRGWS